MAAKASTSKSFHQNGNNFLNKDQKGSNYSVATLYVGGLHKDVSEAMLFDKFNAVGPVLSVQVFRDSVTHRSLGYAYVSFQYYDDAKEALDVMNYDHINGQAIHIMWYQQDLSRQKTGIGNVFIKNLDKSIDKRAMYDTFSAFGKILSCKVVGNEENGSEGGYGFVQFETEEAANTCIQKINGMLLNGKKVYVGKFIPRKEQKTFCDSKSPNFKNVYIKNFGTDFDDNMLYDLFKKFGKITSAKVMLDEDGESKGFGFVSFESTGSARKAVEELYGMYSNGKQLYVGRAERKKERQNSNSRHVNLYVKNLDRSMGDDHLCNMFSRYGTITSAKVMVDSNGCSKGFGFVCFRSPEAASRALEMNGCIVGSQSKRLYVSYALRKEERKAMLTSQYMQRMPPTLHRQMNETYSGYFVPPICQPYYPFQNQANFKPLSPRWR